MRSRRAVSSVAAKPRIGEGRHGGGAIARRRDDIRSRGEQVTRGSRHRFQRQNRRGRGPSRAPVRLSLRLTRVVALAERRTWGRRRRSGLFQGAIFSAD